MLIRVEHATCYAYSEPLVSSTQYLRMTPLSGRTQAVEGWKLTCPGATTTPWQDQYGNLCHTLTVAQPVNELEIKVAGLVRTRDTNGVIGLAPAELPPSHLSARDALYRRLTIDPRLRRPLRGQAQARRDRDAARDHDDHRRRGRIPKGETHVHTTGAEALEQRSGVCQDYAHIFCAACARPRRPRPLRQRLSDP